MTEFNAVLPLTLPMRMCGREVEVSRLIDAFERAADRGPQFVLVAGEPGVGKTSLVDQLRRPVQEVHGFFISGKYEQHARHTPLSAVLEALESLAIQLQDLEDGERLKWRRRIYHGLNGNVPVLTELVPAMEALLGQQPPPAELEPEQSRIRMQNAVLSMLRVVSDAGHTLVLFLDDLQWADAGTFELQDLLLRQDRARILLIGAYRDNEVKGNHPLNVLRERQQSADLATGLPLTEIALAPLSAFDLQTLLKEMLGVRGIELRELAMVCQERTGGNPFHLLQFLLAMHGERLLRYDPDSGSWEWQLERIREMPATGNIIDLLTRRIDAMGPEVREVLARAACFGSRFQVPDLEQLLSDQTDTQLGLLLKRCLGEGFLVAGSDTRIRVGTEDLPLICRFVHDRVEESAYQALDEQACRHTHLQIGWILAQDAQRVVEAAGQFRRALDLLWVSPRRKDAAHIMLKAARVSRKLGAWFEFYLHARLGCELLGDAGWRQAPKLMGALRLAELESAYFAAPEVDCDELLNAALAHVSEPFSRAEFLRVRSGQLVMDGEFDRSMRVGLQGLHACFPHITETPDLGAEVVEKLDAEVTEQMRRLGSDAIGQLAMTEDWAARFVYRCLPSIAFSALAAGNRTMRAYLPLIGMDLALRSGITREAFTILGVYGGYLGTCGRFAEAGTISAQVVADRRFRAVDFGYASGMNAAIHRGLHYARPFAECIARYKEGSAAGQAGGDPFNSLICRLNQVPMMMAQGCPVGSVMGLIQAVRSDNQEWGFALVEENTKIFARYLGGLRKSEFEPVPQTLLDEEVPPRSVQIMWNNQLLLQLRFWLRDEEQLADALAQARQTLPALMGFPQSIEFHFIDAFLLLNGFPLKDEADRQSRMQGALHIVRSAAEACAANYGHLRLILEAEQAWQQDNLTAARTTFERAIFDACEAGNLPYQALANERLAALQEARGKQELANGLRGEAVRIYREWGCLVRAGSLEHMEP